MNAIYSDFEKINIFFNIKMYIKINKSNEYYLFRLLKQFKIQI